MLTIEIKTNSASFTNENTGQPSQQHKQDECARILRKLADQLERDSLQKNHNSVSQCCVDYNGNFVGKMVLSIEE